jgi:hypothetical protein
VIGDYPLTCWTDLVGDGDSSNDACRVNVLVRECADCFGSARRCWQQRWRWR